MAHYVVICRADRVGNKPGNYVLATRRVFTSKRTAKAYAAECSPSREAIVVDGRFTELRFDRDEDSLTNRQNMKTLVRRFPTM